MDYDEIIEEIKPYHWLACNEDECKFIASGDTKKEAKENLMDKLEDIWDKLIGTTIYLANIGKSLDENWENVKKRKNLTPGPIIMTITEYIIQKNNKLKFYSEGINSNVYFTEKYLEKNKKIKKKDIREMVLKYKNRELKKGLMATNIL